MSYVLDASIALSWCFEDEATPITDELLGRLKKESAWVPSLWTLEIGNILVTAQRKQRISYASVSEYLDFLNRLKINVDEETSSRAFKEILALAHSEKLTTYDAAYLELAMRKGLPLASKDKQLVEAAQRLGVSLIKMQDKH